MWQLTTTDPCTESDLACNWVLDTTGSEEVAWVVKFLIGTPLAVATLIVLLASDRTANVTGANYVIDGGLIKTT